VLPEGEATLSTLYGPNLADPLDVNADGTRAAQDALLWINAINEDPPQPTSSLLAAASAALNQPTVYLDVTGDGLLAAFDVLWVINGLNALAQGLPAAAPPAPTPIATEKRCIATLDVGGRSWHPANRASLEAAARRCDAGLVIFTEPLAKCHIWWQKTFAVDCLLQNDHVLQIDADGLIAEDGPSPFPECEPGRLGVCRDLQHPCQYRLARWLSSTTRRWSRYLGLGQPGGR